MNGTYDVDDSVTAFIRTEGPIISLEGAWARNIEPENYIDFIGTEGGIRLVYGGGFSEYKVAWRPSSPKRRSSTVEICS